MWWVYVVRCADGTLYTGVAMHLLGRLREHNQDDRRGARYTRGRRPVALYTACRCADRAAATRLERQVKRLPRSRKEVLPSTASWLTAAEALGIAAAEEDAGVPAVPAGCAR